VNLLGALDVHLAAQSIDSGAARAKLGQLAQFSHQ